MSMLGDLQDHRIPMVVEGYLLAQVNRLHSMKEIECLVSEDDEDVMGRPILHPRIGAVVYHEGKH